MRGILAGIVALIALSPSIVSQAATNEGPLSGRWTVEFSNGVVESCVIGEDRALVTEARRNSGAKIEPRNGSLVITYDDGRLERWTAFGNRAVVEHWFPVNTYPSGRPVVGIAAASPLAWAEQSSQPDKEAVAATKAFFAGLQREAGDISKSIDPRYLKKHGVGKKPLPIPRPVAGALYDRAEGTRTVLVVVETNDTEREIWLLPVTEYKGKLVVLPPEAPDPKTRSITPWSLRKKLPLADAPL